MADIERRVRVGEFARGQLLPSERRLCADYGVSRTLLREVLRQLAARGHIRSEPGRGNRVLPLGEAARQALWGYLRQMRPHVEAGAELRLALEPFAARLCARRGDPACHAALAAAARSSVDDPERHLADDRRFHAAIAAGCGNRLIADILSAIVDLTDATRDPAHFWDPASAARTIAEHASISACVAAGEEDGAAVAMEGHLRRVYARVLARIGRGERP